MKPAFLIAGYGYLGRAVREVLHDSFQIYTISRSPKEHQGHIAADLSSKEVVAKLPANLAGCLYCPSPDARDEEAYSRVYIEGLKNILSGLGETSKDCQVLLVSSTSVYSQNNGEAVDEESKTSGNRFNARVILEAEKIARASKRPSSVLRFSGIYGPGRIRFRTKAAELTEAPEDSLKITNRIHVEDGARAIRFSMENKIENSPQSTTYIVSDSGPTPKIEVLNWLRQEQSLPAIELANSGTNFKSGKLCKNDKLLKTGFQFKYPTY